MPGVQPLALFQGGQAIVQHVLDVKRPEGDGDEHPVAQPLQGVRRPAALLAGGRVITPERRRRRIGLAIGAGVELFQVGGERGGHGGRMNYEM